VAGAEPQCVLPCIGEHVGGFRLAINAVPAIVFLVPRVLFGYSTGIAAVAVGRVASRLFLSARLSYDWPSCSFVCRTSGIGAEPWRRWAVSRPLSCGTPPLSLPSAVQRLGPASPRPPRAAFWPGNTTAAIPHPATFPGASIQWCPPSIPGRAYQGAERRRHCHGQGLLYAVVASGPTRAARPNVVDPEGV
jgi:hypothetical protein